MSDTPIATRCGPPATAAEVIDGVDLTGKRAIVTGASSGIGIETARALAGAGAEVTLAVRNTEQGEQVAADFGSLRLAGDGHPRTSVCRLDLSDLAGVAEFVGAWDGPLDILV